MARHVEQVVSRPCNLLEEDTQELVLGVHLHGAQDHAVLLLAGSTTTHPLYVMAPTSTYVLLRYTVYCMLMLTTHTEHTVYHA